MTPWPKLAVATAMSDLKGGIWPRCSPGRPTPVRSPKPKEVEHVVQAVAA